MVHAFIMLHRHIHILVRYHSGVCVCDFYHEEKSSYDQSILLVHSGDKGFSFSPFLLYLISSLLGARLSLFQPAIHPLLTPHFSGTIVCHSKHRQKHVRDDCPSAGSCNRAFGVIFILWTLLFNAEME